MLIFLGYAREDVEHAKEVAACLIGAGYEVWRDGDFLVGGDDWNAERLVGQREADFIVHLISPVIDRRRSVAMREIRETLRLLEDEPFGSNLAMFMRLEEYRVPWQLTTWHYVDKWNDSWQSNLLRGVEKRAAQLAGRHPEEAKLPMEKPAVAEVASEAVPSKSIEISDGVDGFTSRATYLKYKSKAPFWKLVNASIASRALSYHVGWQSQSEIFLEGRGENSEELWQEVVVSEFFRTDEFLSVRIYYHYYSGGAHPNHGIESLNFFASEGGLVSIRNLLNWDEEAAKEIAGLAFDRIVAADGTNEDGTTFALTTREEMQADAWDRLARFTFDKNAITFAFPPYEVLPYACGIPECVFFWPEIEDKVSERYKPLIDRVRRA